MNKWIPVKETKPAGAQRVMAVVVGLGRVTNKPVSRSVATNLIYHNRQFKELHDQRDDEYVPIKWPFMVTHWRPIPPVPSLEECAEIANSMRKPRRPISVNDYT